MYALVISVVGLLGTIYPLVLLGKQISNQDYRNLTQFVMGLVADIIGVFFVLFMILLNKHQFHLININKVSLLANSY